jgi:prolyl oligopeptidase
LSAAAKRRALVVASGLALLGAAAAASVWPPPPRTEVRPVIDRIHNTDTVDPYRWLEDQNAPQVRRWIAEQNAYADAVLNRSGERPQLTALLRRFMDRPDVGRAQRGGAFEYFTLRREGEEQAAVYRRPAPAIRGERIDPSGTYDLAVEPRALSGELTTSVDVMAVTADGDRLIYGVRDGGQDERELVVRELKTMTDVERFPAALHDSVSLRKDGAGFFYVRRSRETGARVRFHAWGARIDSDEVLFGDGYGPTAFVSMTQSDDATQFVYTVQHGWARSEVWLKSTDAITPAVTVVKDVDAHFYPRFVKREIWMRTDLDAPRGRVVAVDMTAPSDRTRWRTVLPEERDTLEDFAVIGDRVYATYMRDASSRVRMFPITGGSATDLDIPDLASAAIRADGDQAAILSIESFTAPETRYRIDFASGTRTVDQAPRLTWDVSRYSVERIYATSKDGTRVPVFVFGRADRRRDGSNRVLLFGYGGFVAPQKPRFTALAAAWVESGGVYASAVLRGGSEFGERWHRDGMLTNKQHVFDDFIAAAEALIADGTTRPERLAIMGTSNGGLLVGAALTQRPELFGAVFVRLSRRRHAAFQSAQANQQHAGVARIRRCRHPGTIPGDPSFFSFAERATGALPGGDDLVGRPRHARAAARGAKVHGVIADSQHVGPARYSALFQQGRARDQQRPAVFDASRSRGGGAGVRANAANTAVKDFPNWENVHACGPDRVRPLTPRWRQSSCRSAPFARAEWRFGGADQWCG